jgi:MFS transporter, MHS family, shikimate and dehydroshikimate transport protein
MTTAGADAVGRSQVRRTALVSLLGSTIEWYDFFIYGTAAALVLNKAFFPNAGPFVGTLAAFSSFAVGFLARPIGGVIWCHFGDRIGRKKALVSALFLMGGSTTLVGLLPSYATIGVAAPILLFVLRILQGLAVGGQWGGAVLIATEYAPPNRKGWYGSFPQLGVPIAVILSNGIFLALEAGLDREAFTSWGWRVPFLLSVLLIGVAFYAQVRLEDTPAFRHLQEESGATRRSPVVEVLRSHPKQVLLAAGSFIAVNGASTSTSSTRCPTGPRPSISPSRRC